MYGQRPDWEHHILKPWAEVVNEHLSLVVVLFGDSVANRFRSNRVVFCGLLMCVYKLHWPKFYEVILCFTSSGLGMPKLQLLEGCWNTLRGTKTLAELITVFRSGKILLWSAEKAYKLNSFCRKVCVSRLCGRSSYRGSLYAWEWNVMARNLACLV